MSALRSVRVLASAPTSSSPVGTACLRELMSRCIRSSPGPGSWARRARGQALVGAPGGLDRGVALVGEEVLQALGLGVGEQVGARQQRAPGPVEGVVLAAPTAGGLALDAAAALVEPVSCQGHDARRDP